MPSRLPLLSTLAQWGLPPCCALLGWTLGRPSAGLALALAVWAWPFTLLALEFALLPWVGRHDPAPRPRAAQLVRAWRRECALWLRVFNLEMPWRADALPDQPEPAGAAGRRGVVLVHGFVCNRGFWNPWLARLRQEGHPCIAVNLGPDFAPIDALCAPLEDAVARLQASTGRPPLIVAHSMGGLVVRAWLRQDRQRRGTQAPPRVVQVLTLGSPHHGTVLARFALGRSGRQMRRQGAWLRALAADEPASFGARFTCVYSHCDNVVMPASTAVLPGAQAVHLDGTPHVGLAFDPRSQALAWRWLEGDDGRPA